MAEYFFFFFSFINYDDKSSFMFLLFLLPLNDQNHYITKQTITKKIIDMPLYFYARFMSNTQEIHTSTLTTFASDSGKCVYGIGKSVMKKNNLLRVGRIEEEKIVSKFLYSMNRTFHMVRIMRTLLALPLTSSHIVMSSCCRKWAYKCIWVFSYTICRKICMLIECVCVPYMSFWITKLGRIKLKKGVWRHRKIRVLNKF